ncbi:MAG: Cys-tRNA(Pro) deacylase [Oscillospiraceae bacterium]|nr:Cys-tRNA(Pro) deacylase [Oscillospiraceae bacterium]
MKVQKTIVEKLLDQKKIAHQSYTYPADGFSDGVTVAGYINKPVEQVFKTLVTTGSKGIHVFVVPVAAELDLKKAAKVSGQKYVEMIPQKDLLSTTGYIKGGCSPIGMKKRFPTFIDKSRENFDSIIFSAGKIGKQVQVGLSDLISLTGATTEFICKEEPCL